VYLRKPNKYRPEYHPKNEYADNENNLADFYPHIEEQQRQRNCLLRQPNLVERACESKAVQKLTGRIELNPTGRENTRLVAKLELTGEKIQLLADEALKGR